MPDAISQLEQVDRDLLTRRDIERLFGVGKVRAAALMKTFGAEFVGNQRTLPRTRLLQQLKRHRGRAAFRVEEERRARVAAELQKARLTGVGFKVPVETMSAKLANLPDGVSLERGRIEVRSTGGGRPGAAVLAGPGARERSPAVPGARRSLSQRGRRGDGMTTETLAPPAAAPAIANERGRESPAAGDRRRGAPGGGAVP